MRKLLIAAFLFLVGAVIYFAVSQGPVRVQLVTVPVQLLYLLSISYLAWLAPLRPRVRVPALLAAALVISTLAVYLDSFVIMALRPLHPVYFARGILGLLVEGALFLGLTWLIDRGLEVLRVRRQRAGVPPS